MENAFSQFIETSKSAVKHWWLLMLLGIALFGTGVFVFIYPAESYLSLAILFGVLMLVSGIFEIILSTTNKHYITGRGWMLASGIIQVLLGIILSCNVGLSVIVLPIVLAFWLMIRAFSTIGWGGDMSTLKVPGAVWTIICGVLLLLLSIWILLQPLAFGTTMVVVWVGISLLIAGVTAFLFSFQLRSIHKHLE